MGAKGFVVALVVGCLAFPATAWRQNAQVIDDNAQIIYGGVAGVDDVEVRGTPAAQTDRASTFSGMDLERRSLPDSSAWARTRPSATTGL